MAPVADIPRYVKPDILGAMKQYTSDTEAEDISFDRRSKSYSLHSFTAEAILHRLRLTAFFCLTSTHHILMRFSPAVELSRKE